jgi:hypothetical protein
VYIARDADNPIACSKHQDRFLRITQLQAASLLLDVPKARWEVLQRQASYTDDALVTPPRSAPEVNIPS